MSATSRTSRAARPAAAYRLALGAARIRGWTPASRTPMPMASHPALSGRAASVARLCFAARRRVDVESARVAGEAPPVARAARPAAPCPAPTSRPSLLDSQAASSASLAVFGCACSVSPFMSRTSWEVGSGGFDGGEVRSGRLCRELGAASVRPGATCTSAKAVRVLSCAVKCVSTRTCVRMQVVFEPGAKGRRRSTS